MSIEVNTFGVKNPLPIEEQRVLFCVPESTQFPVDIVTQQIVEGLLYKKGSVEGISVEFSEIQEQGTIYKAISKIKGADFTLTFSRYQKWDRYTPHLSRIVIPGQKLEVFSDGSGPILTVYAGNDWEKDRSAFTETCTQTVKERGQQLAFLKYSGCFKKLGEQRPDTLLLVEVKELAAKENYPNSYTTHKVFADFVAYLEANVLQKILGNNK